MANQRDLIAENIEENINEKTNILKNFKDEHLLYVREYDLHLSNYRKSEEALKKSVLEYEKALKEFLKTNYDQQKSRVDLAKANYKNHLRETNIAKKQFYEEQLPEIMKKLQSLEERRIKSFKEYLNDSVTCEIKLLPRIQKCYNEIQAEINRITSEKDVEIIIDFFKSGYKIPDDYIFQDLFESYCKTRLNKNSSIKTKNIGILINKDDKNLKLKVRTKISF